MNQSQIIEKLKERVAKDPAAKDICYVWATRQRARAQVTTLGLSQRMREEKFEHDNSDYNSFLKFVGSLGLGRVESMGRGQVKLKEISTTLQSIGQAALGQRIKFEVFKQRNKFQALQVKTQQLQKVVEETTKTGYPVSITVVIDGKPINMRVPKEMDEKDLANLIARFRDKAVV